MTGYVVKNNCGCDGKDKKRIILECGRSVEVADFNVAVDQEQTFILARVFIDTSSLNTQVKIDFSTIILFESDVDADDIDIALTFKLNRKCGTADPSVLKTWEYRKKFMTADLTTIIREAFNFSFCDTQECPDGDPREYFLEVTANPANDFTGIATATVNPDGAAFISAIAQ
ncbi:DUF4489 domain-containing protein [Wukongibacter baidiensis]|uniref:DUF4489 domain-containing protein n=1 Tax=Wukongibacter baidiensis TaxID=1723361 RepID=UPI003D7F3C53